MSALLERIEIARGRHTGIESVWTVASDTRWGLWKELEDKLICAGPFVRMLPDGQIQHYAYYYCEVD